jgi:hypothetical protein
MDYKDFLGVLAVALGAYSYVPYLYGMVKGTVTPHFFTWCIWALICGIGFAAQLHDNAGPGSWVMGFTAVVCVVIAALSLKWGEKVFTRSDKISFALALSAIPLWVVTKNPLWSVILISCIDLAAFYPTVRKSWHRPWSEGTLVYLLCSIKFGLSLAAMDNLTWVTGLYAASMVLVYGAFYVMLLVRRRVIGKSISL